MREYSFNIDEALRNGLRPDPRTPINSPFMTNMRNLRASMYLAKTPEPVSYPIETPAFDVFDWPFPQLFKGKDVTLLCAETAIYSVASDWTATQLTTFDFADSANGWVAAKAITAGGPWHFLDMYGTWMLFNGACVVMKLPNITSKVLVQDAVTVNTGCVHKEGRHIFGGFDASDYRTAAWATFLDGFEDEDVVPAGIQALTNNAVGAGPNWVAWGTIGGGDMLTLFSHAYALNGSFEAAPTTGYGTNNPYLFDLWRRNEAGVRPMPWQGAVMRTLPLGAANSEPVIVCGEDGVAALVPAYDPVATYGLRMITDLDKGIGLLSRSAVADGAAGQLFLDQNAEAWLIGPDLAALHLNRGEFLAALANEGDVCVSYDPVEKEYWIASATQAYVYCASTGGFGGPFDVRPTSLIRDAAGALVGPTAGLDAESLTIQAESGAFNMSERGLKHINMFQVASENVSDMKGRVSYRYDNDGSFGDPEWRNANPQGVVHQSVSFAACKIGVQGTVPLNETGGIELVEVQYQSEDRRFRRGTKGVPPGA